MGSDMRQTLKEHVMLFLNVLDFYTIYFFNDDGIILLYYDTSYYIKRSLLYHNGDGIEMFRKTQCALRIIIILTPN